MLATRVDGDSMRVIESASKGISCIVRASAKHEAITHIRSPIGAITKGIVGWNINHVFVERNDSSDWHGVQDDVVDDVLIQGCEVNLPRRDRKSTRLNSSH